MFAKLAVSSLAILALSCIPARAAHHDLFSTPSTPSKVLTIVEENHSYAEARAGMPYLASLANRYAYASNFHAETHPSLPNYLAIAGGSTFGVTSDSEPIPSSRLGSSRSVFGQALARGLRAKLYAESMPSNCYAYYSGSYAPKHNPWAYFGAESSKCKQYDVPSGFLTDASANALPHAGMLIPNLANDAHNGSLLTADNWLRSRLPTVLASSDFLSGRLTVVVTFDEDDSSASNQILTVVMNVGMTRHGAVSTAMNHYALTGYYDHVLGAPLLGRATTGMNTAFGLK